MLWFSEKERAIATSLGSMSNLLGIAISYVISPVIVPGDNPNESIYLFTYLFVDHKIQINKKKLKHCY